MSSSSSFSGRGRSSECELVGVFLGGSLCFGGALEHVVQDGERQCPHTAGVVSVAREHERKLDR